MVRFINDHRDEYGIESICAVVPIAPSTYFRQRARQGDPTRRPARARRDDELRAAIQRVWDEHQQCMGRGRCGGNCGATASAWRGAPSSA
jgi:putative transposase